jgi:hypothetical protein
MLSLKLEKNPSDIDDPGDPGSVPMGHPEPEEEGRWLNVHVGNA